jgi:hypothetical protein
MQYQLFVAELRDRNEVLFAFSVAPRKLNFLTVMVLVLLIYVLYKSFEIDGRSFTHLKSFPLLFILRKSSHCIIHLDIPATALWANANNDSGRDTITGYFCPLEVETKGWPFRSKSGT